MSDMALFEGNSLVSSDLFKSLQDVDDNLAGGSGGSGPRRISIRGGRFREMVAKSFGLLNGLLLKLSAKVINSGFGWFKAVLRRAIRLSPC